MTFYIWFIVWLLGATSLVSLLTPCIAVTIRSSYLCSMAILLKPQHLVMATIIFLFMFIPNPNEPGKAAIVAGSSVSWMMLLTHIHYRTRTSEFRSMGATLSSLALLAGRYLDTLDERRRDFEYAQRVARFRQISRGLGLLKARVSLLLKVVRSIGADILVLKKQVYVVVKSRGALPDPRPLSRRRVSLETLAVPMGDILFLAGTTMMCVWAGRGLLSQSMEIIVAWIKSIGSSHA